MNAKSFSKLEALAAKCGESLRDKRQQSRTIFRGEMWAIVSAHHDISKLRKRAVPSASAGSMFDHHPHGGRVGSKEKQALAPAETPADLLKG